jgi:hypothetical protein
VDYTHHFNSRLKYVADVVMELKSRIKKYFQVFNRVNLSFRGFIKLTIIDQYDGFLWESYNFSFADAALDR